MPDLLTGSSSYVSVDEVPAVLIHLNVGNYPKFFPKWMKPVHKNFDREDTSVGKGRKIIQCKQVEMKFILDDLGNRGFILIRAHRLVQPNGHLRMIIVAVRKNLTHSDSEMRMVRQGEIRELIKRFFWDTTVYRNYRSDGGNFVIDAGNPKRADGRSSIADLQLDEAGQFIFDTSDLVD